MMYQYSFFQVEEKPWEDIDEVWLLEYMQEHFPDLFFEIDNGKVKSKDGQLRKRYPYEENLDKSKAD